MAQNSSPGQKKGSCKNTAPANTEMAVVKLAKNEVCATLKSRETGRYDGFSFCNTVSVHTVPVIP